jgi:hypothetical protein
MQIGTRGPSSDEAEMSEQPTDEQVSAAARELGIPEVCIRARLLLGWRPYDALTKPPRRRDGFVLRSWKWLDRTGLLDQAKEKP